MYRLETLEADPVSISLAYRSAARPQIDEGNISYGFKKIPVDQPTVKIVKNIPEEKLWAIDRSVIELKHQMEQSAEMEGGDYVDEDENAARNRLNPGYADLGYAPVIKPIVSKRRKTLDFKLEPLTTKDENEHRELDDEECTYRRSKILTIDNGGNGGNGGNNYDSTEAKYAFIDYGI